MSIDNPLVSVILPTYNRADCLPFAINSVLTQTYPKLELIIIDNTSSDTTSEIVQRYQNTDDRISFFTIKNNGLISVSRNYGISRSRGELIAFIDSDDYWHTDKLAVAVNAMSASVSLLYHDMEITFAKSPLRQSTSPRSTKSPDKTNFKDLLFRGNCICNSSVVVRRSALEAVNGITEDPRLVGAEDYYTWLVLFKAGCQSLKLPAILGTLTIRHDAMTSITRDYIYTQCLLNHFALDLNLMVPRWAILKILSYQSLHPSPINDLKLWFNYLRKQRNLIASFRLLLLLILFSMRLHLLRTLSSLSVIYSNILRTRPHHSA